MELNKFELTGRINFIDVKATTSGMYITKVLMSKKGKNDSYQSFNITFFGDIAEKAGDNIKKGDSINVIGRLTEDKYEKDGKSISRLSLIGNEFKLVEYNSEKHEYVELNSNEGLPWEK